MPYSVSPSDKFMCPLCDRVTPKIQFEEVGLCQKCEIEYHGCSTGDCPHYNVGECTKALKLVKAEQEFRLAIPPTDTTE